MAFGTSVPISIEGMHPRKTIVVVGLGMVALSFIEKVVEYDTEQVYEIKVFSEEPHGKNFAGSA